MVQWGLVAVVVGILTITTSVISQSNEHDVFQSVRDYSITYPQLLRKNHKGKKIDFTSLLTPSDGKHPNVHKSKVSMRLTSVFGERYTLELELDNLDFIEVTETNSTHSVAKANEKCVYKGTVKSYLGSSVSLTTCQQNVKGFWIIGNNTFFITKLPNTYTGRVNRREKAYLVYRQTDIIDGSPYSKIGYCGSSHNPTGSSTPLDEFEIRSPTKEEEEERREDLHSHFLRSWTPPQPPSDYYLNILVVSDGTVSCTDLAQLISATQPKYQAQFSSIYYFSVAMCIQTSTFAPTSNAAQDILTAFGTWLSTTTYTYDVAFFFTGRQFDSNVLGLSNVGVVCLAGGSASSTIHIGPNSAMNVAVFAHEMGHTFSMQHDVPSINGCPSSGYIMEAVISSTIPTQFSSCSINYINTYTGNPCGVLCLTDPSAGIYPGCGSMDATCGSQPISSFSGAPYVGCPGADQSSCYPSCQATTGSSAGSCFSPFRYDNVDVCMPSCIYDVSSSSCVPRPASTSLPSQPSLQPSSLPSSTSTPSIPTTTNSLAQQVSSECQQLFPSKTVSSCSGTDPSADCQLMCQFAGDPNCYAILNQSTQNLFCRPDCTSSGSSCLCPDTPQCINI